MISSERIRELKIDSTFWATPAKIVNLLDFDPKKKSIDTKLNSISNTPDTSSKDLIEVHQVRCENGGFYLVIDDIKGYFNLDDNTSGILDMILTDYQKNKYHQVWKEVFKTVNPLSTNPAKWSNTLKQFVGNLPTNCLSVFDHFMNLALKGLMVEMEN